MMFIKVAIICLMGTIIIGILTFPPLGILPVEYVIISIIFPIILLVALIIDKNRHEKN